MSLRSPQLSSISFSVYLLSTLSHRLRPSHTLIALSRRSVHSGNPQTFQETPTTSGPPAPPEPHVPCSAETVLAGGCGVMDGRTRVRGVLCPRPPSRLRSQPHRRGGGSQCPLLMGSGGCTFQGTVGGGRVPFFPSMMTIESRVTVFTATRSKGPAGTSYFFFCPKHNIPAQKTPVIPP